MKITNPGGIFMQDQFNNQPNQQNEEIPQAQPTQNVSETANSNPEINMRQTEAPQKEPTVTPSFSESTAAQPETYQPTSTETPLYNYNTGYYNTAPPKTKKKKTSKTGPWLTISIICMILTAFSIAIASTSLYAVYNNTKSQGSSTSQNTNIVQQQTPDYTPEQTEETNAEGLTKLTAEEAIRKVEPSTGQVLVSGPTGSGSGSGVIMSEDGYILTNAHVIADATSAQVITSDGAQHTATIIGYDSATDTGVLKIEGQFTAATFGDSSKLVQGEEVIAIGTPYSSDLYNTCTKGIVSGLRNNITFQSLGLTLNVIQHDAAINSGNSGGPLINLYGQVIGINSVKISGVYEGLCFSIQINDMLNNAKQIIENGSIERPVIGITGASEQTIGAVYVVEVMAGGPAEAAGIQTGDIITKVDDTRTETIDILSNYIKSKQIGDTVTLVVIRNGEQISITVTLGSSVS